MDKTTRQKKFGIPQHLYNSFISNSDRNKRSERGETGLAADHSFTRGDIKLKNTSGGNLVAGRVLEIGASLLTTYDPRYPGFTGSTPAPNGTKGIAVTIFPCANDDIVWCKSAGLVYAKVNINHEQQTRADVDSSSTLLQSKWYGRAEIVAKESTGTGEKACWIRLGEMFRGPIEVIITAGSGIAPGSSGNAKVRWSNADASPTSTITVYYDWMEGAANAGLNKEAVVFWVPDRQKFVIYELQC